jgi:hypothetical protein
MLVIGLVGCSTSNGSKAASEAASGEPTGVGVPVVAEVPQLAASRNLRLPLDDYLPSVRDLHQRGLARRKLISRCLLRMGVDVSLPKPVTDIGPRTWMERRYGLADVGQAAALGYGLGKREPSVHRGETAARLSPTALTVLTGEGAALLSRLQVPPGGCSGEAQRALAGTEDGQELDPYLAQRLSQESFERSRLDPRVLEAFEDWSQCMRGHGHDYGDPLAPFSDRSLQRGATRKAIDTAVDDVQCKKRTNLVGIWYAVESAYQVTLIEDHRAALDALAAANAVTSEVVDRVLNASDKEQ